MISLILFGIRVRDLVFIRLVCSSIRIKINQFFFGSVGFGNDWNGGLGLEKRG